jgi:hypothetical protein
MDNHNASESNSDGSTPVTQPTAPVSFPPHRDRHQPRTYRTGSRDAREILHGPRCSSVMLFAHALLQPSSPAPSGPASRRAAATLAPRHRCRHIGSRGVPHGTAPSAQLLPFPLRPDLRRHARTPHARAGVRVAAARARHAGAGPHAGRGPHARRHGAAASPGGGWGGAREGGVRARRGSS